MTISKLIKKYESNRDHYLSADYNETQLRTDFLDPFFELLGWDINNAAGKSTYEREVLLEEALKGNATSNTKKPDYTFRQFSERKFFVEAKKPHIKIETANSPARQVRRYGFTGKLKISILSNFEHLAIYDCSKPVSPTDKFSHSRIKIYHYSEYTECFEDIKKEIGKDSIYDGLFDRKWAHIEAEIKKFSVDDLFLEQINNWRSLLGNEIHTHDNKLDNNQLNDLVQRFINSIIFLRVCEDRSLEVYKTLLKPAKGKDYKELIEQFRTADRKYNSGLFNHPFTSKIIKENHSSFWKIITELYYPESTYSFSVFSSDILGSIYEMFLGDELVIHENSVKLEKKPEHIDRDVVTTPVFIINSIILNSLGPLCEGKTAEEVLDLKLADIACGSGAFLLEAYEYLLGVLVDWYQKHQPDKLIQKGKNAFTLPFDIKKSILTNCIFGVDKDFCAVEACKFGLLLKLLEDEDNEGLPAPALPILNNNVHYGNSLISNVTHPNHIQTINPYTFGEIKYDLIIGNPPYMATEHMKEHLPLELPIYKNSFASAYMQFDKCFLFVERGLELLKPNGRLAFILPNKFLKTNAARKLRSLLANEKYVEKIVSFGANQIFQDKTTYTCLLFLNKGHQNQVKHFEVENLADWRAKKSDDFEYGEIPVDKLSDEGWILTPKKLENTFSKIQAQSTTIADLFGESSIYNGIQTSANSIYIHSQEAEDAQYIYFTKDNKSWKVEKKLTRPYFKTAKGKENLNTYRPFSANAFVIYPYMKDDSGRLDLVEYSVLKKTFPYTYKYLNSYQHILDNPKRDIKPAPNTLNEWYRYGRHQSLEKCDVPAKIIVGVLSKGEKYSIDYSGTLISSGGTAGYCMITPPSESPYSIYYIQAILNSKYVEWVASQIGEVFRGGYIARGTKILKRLPMRRIDFNDTQDRLIHNQISKLQKDLISLQGEIDDVYPDERKSIPLKREFESKRNELNNKLAELYSLGDDDTLIPLISEVYAAR